MMNKLKLLLIFYLGIQLGCTVKDVQKFDIEPVLSAAFLSASESDKPVNMLLCAKTPFKWNELILVPPYSELDVVDDENLENMGAIEKLMLGLTADEGYFVLLFIKNKTIVRYSLAPRVNVDFMSLFKQQQLTMKISRNDVCNHLVVKKMYDRYLPSL